MEVLLTPPTPSSEEVDPVVGEGEEVKTTVAAPELIVTVRCPPVDEQPWLFPFPDFSKRYVVLSLIRADSSASLDLSVKFCRVSSSRTRSSWTWN